MNKTMRTFLNVLVGSTYCRHRMQITSWGIFLKTLTRLKAGVLFYECCSSFKSLLSASVQEPGCRRRGKDALTFAPSNVRGRTPRHPAPPKASRREGCCRQTGERWDTGGSSLLQHTSQSCRRNRSCEHARGTCNCGTSALLPTFNDSIHFPRTADEPNKAHN